jgi:septal ring factor EnvC (AmiA/AmiB activator)
VLSQQDFAGFSRKLTYYGYIARQRSALLADLERQLDALDALARDLQEQIERLQDLGARRSARLDQVAAARKVRAVAVQTLEHDIGTRQQRLTHLQEQAKALEDLLSRLERERRRARPADREPPAPAPPRGFGAVTGLPLKGRLLGDYGQPRADGLMRWDGLLLEAAPGTEVRAVRGGRVVFADYLPGMGQLVVVDHGDGYMTLYGHNQDLTRQVGERIGAGDVVAHVGDSGGEGNPGLYFELRRNGRPVNPHAWVK